MFVFGIRWKISYFSILGLYQVIDTALEMIGFTLATICLTRAKNLTVVLLSMGYLIIISSDILIRYHVVSGANPSLTYFETTWVLGLLLMSVGFYLLRKNEMVLLPINSLQSSIAIWMLNICLLFMALFVGATCLFSDDIGYDVNQVNINLLSIFIPFSIVAIIISKYLSSKISSPLEKLEIMIRKFSTNELSSHSREDEASGNSLFEFATLENFIYDAFSIQQKKRLVEIELANISTQVAHDIRSPLASLTILTNQESPFSDESRSILRSVANRIRDIANDLIDKHRSSENLIVPTNDSEVQLLTTLIYPIITEKRLQLGSNSQITIEFVIIPGEYGLFAMINSIDFKRMLSNLINNSIESFTEKGNVIVKLERNTNSILLTINDNGKGIPSHIFENIGNRGNTFGKEHGSGLGLYHARKTIELWGGSLKIESQEHIGTTVEITLPLANSPEWFVEQLPIPSNSNIVILDDDASIHQVWKRVFEKADSKNANIKIFHFSMPEQLIHGLESNFLLEKQTLFLVDYEFLGTSQTGIDIIESLQIQSRSILVTSHYEEAIVKSRCNELGVKVIPKDMAGFVPVIVETISDKESY